MSAVFFAQPVVAVRSGTVVDENRWGRLFAVVIAGAWAASVAIGFERSLMLLTLVGLASMALGVLHTPLGLMGITILCLTDAPARVYVMTGGLLRWNTMNYLLVLILLAVLPTLARFRDPHTRLLQVYAVLLCFGVLLSPSFSDGVQEVLTVVTSFGLLYFLARAATSRELWYWMGANGALITALMGLAYYRESDSLQPMNPNAWALTLLGGVFATCLAFPVTEGRPMRRLYLLGLFSLAMVWVFLSGSRGSLIIGLGCTMILVLAMRGITTRIVTVVGGLAIAIAAASFFGDLQQTAAHRLDKLFNRNTAIREDLSWSERTSGRSDLMIGGLHIFRANPLGVGTGGFPYAWERLDTEAAGVNFKSGRQFNAHSGWIKVLAENGIPATAVLLAWVLSFAAVGVRQRDRRRRLIGYMATAALGLALVSTEFQAKTLWFLAAGTTVVLSRRRCEGGEPLFPPSLAGGGRGDDGV